MDTVYKRNLARPLRPMGVLPHPYKGMMPIVRQITRRLVNMDTMLLRMMNTLGRIGNLTKHALATEDAFGYSGKFTLSPIYRWEGWYEWIGYEH